MPNALLVHGVGTGPTSMWRFEEWLGPGGWETGSFAPISREIVAGTGHSPHRDDPATTLAKLERWIAERR